jgi:hypothetical protein
MIDVKITLSFIWVALMLIYLLGDVLRIFAGDFTPGEVEGKPVTSKMYFGMAVIMVIPIIMVVLNLVLVGPVNKWVNVIVASVFFIFNLIGIKGYKAYDVFLLIISFGLNFLTIWFALTQI